MSEVFDIVIPLYQVRWNTRAVLEGLTTHYQPRAIHVVAPGLQARSLREMSREWDTAPLYTHEEEIFFQPVGLTKDLICAEIDLGQSLYTPGWFYQQLLKLGAFEGIDNLSQWYVVWDSDLLPVNTWELIEQGENTVKHSFALLQDNGYGNPGIVGKWETWINSVLGVDALTDVEGTFIPHHMWFKQEHLKSFATQVNKYYESSEHWLLLMMQSANEFGTFSEYWSYVSWVSKQAPDDLYFYPYKKYGETTERFFDDGTGLFSAALKQYQRKEINSQDPLVPSYAEISSFINAEYGKDALPSSLSFESSPRHLKKDEKNMHIEEKRSRWNP
ncbi:MAG: hypothetical protein ACFCAD_19560, partial [Pleurocapsa sp.]